jgi:hypothetical protein
VVIEVAVGLLVAWFARKAGRVGKRLDGITDEAIDASADKLHALVMAKLGADPALAKLAAEAADTGDAAARTKARVELALEEAAESDAEFAAALTAVTPSVASVGNVTADRGGIAFGVVTGGSVNVNQHPPGPARSQG